MTRNLPLKSLSSNVLCERHNTMLSRLDSIGGAFFSALGEVQILSGNTVCREINRRFNGHDIERFLLKLGAGFLTMASRHAEHPSTVGQGIVSHILEGTGLLPPHGLWIRSSLSEEGGEVFDPDQSGGPGVANHMDGQLCVGFEASFHCAQLLVWIDPRQRHPSQKPGMGNVTFRPKRIFATSKDGARAQVHLSWGEAPHGVHDVEMVRHTDPGPEHTLSKRHGHPDDA